METRIRAVLEADPVEDGYTHPVETLLEEVVEIIVAAVHQNLVSVDELEPKVKEEIEKAIAT